jgi:hypothetical protein
MSDDSYYPSDLTDEQSGFTPIRAATASFDSPTVEALLLTPEGRG